MFSVVTNKKILGKPKPGGGGYFCQRRGEFNSRRRVTQGDVVNAPDVTA